MIVIDKIKNKTKFDYLLKRNFITHQELKEAFKIAQKENKSVEFILINQFNVPKTELGKALSLYYNCEFYSFSPNINVPKDLIKGLKKEFLERNLWVPLKEENGKTIILINDPYDIDKTDIIKKFFKNVKIKVAIREDILEVINYFWNNLNKPTETELVRDFFVEFQDDILPEESYPSLEDDLLLSENRVVKFVHTMILDAWEKGASDIHIEPCSLTYKTDIRFRIDGVCQHYATIPNSIAREVVSRIKIMANLDIAEKRLPQDGKIKFMKDGKLLLELRVATLPSVGGLEDVVLRLLSTGTPMDLEKLGMTQDVLEKFKKLIKKPYGLILVVGPTGSGKTTTLHSALKCINTPEIKIWTAEDPVEITQKGLRQIEVNPKIGLTFARIMRAFLRADPDVIMIGEMRDKETASIAIEASLTGHLVFSTLHTNSAPETITRLLDMELDPFNFADSLLGVLAQRLIRKLCPHCKEEYHPSEEEFNELVEEFGKDQFEKMNIKYTPDLKLYRPRGCKFCGNTGYKGRIGIYELLVNSSNIKKLIKRKAPTEEIRKVAVSEGMMTLKQDGILKVFQGISDFKEVKRVCIE